MTVKVRSKSSPRKKAHFKRKKRIRSHLRGSAQRPRLTVFRSNRHIYAQIIDDDQAHTLASASTVESENRDQNLSASVESAKVVGHLIGKRAVAKSIGQVVFDRSGYVYHGRIRALADGARESGLKF